MNRTFSKRLFLASYLIGVAAILPTTGTTAAAQVSSAADGAVTIDLSVLGQGVSLGGPALSGQTFQAPGRVSGLQMPGTQLPRSQLYIQGSAAPAVPAPVTSGTQVPAPTAVSSFTPPADVTAEVDVAPPPAPAPSAPVETAAIAPEPTPDAPVAPVAPSAPSAVEAPVADSGARALTPSTQSMASQSTDSQSTASASEPIAPAIQTASVADVAPEPPAAPEAPPAPPAAPASGGALTPPPPPAPALPVEPTETKPSTSSTSTASLTPAGTDGKLLTIPFAEGEWRLPDGQKEALENLTNQVKDNQQVRLQLLAYAGGQDLRANRARRLSLSRALSIRSYLIENGIRSTRIDVRALGNKSSEEPINRVDIKLADR